MPSRSSTSGKPGWEAAALSALPAFANPASARLENDFLVFRGNEHEASGQLLKGVLTICVPSPIKIEDIHMRLTGVQRLA